MKQPKKTVLEKYLVPRNEQRRREKLCKACHHYNKRTNSCGRFLLGSTIVDRESGIVYNLCGCPIPTMTRASFKQCPIPGEGKKWGKYSPVKDPGNVYEDVKRVLKEIEDRKHPRYKEVILDTEMIDAVYAVHEVVYGSKNHCHSCQGAINRAVEELQQFVDTVRDNYE